MYLRFITEYINEDGAKVTGIFKALRFVREHSVTSDEDVAKLEELRIWFNQNLDTPTKFSNAGNKNPERKSLSWFKDSAKIHINKIQQIKEILYNYGIIIEMVTSKNPGYIVYEDDYQVSAMPFRTDRKKVI